MGSGKTSLVQRYVRGHYYENQESTIGASFFTKTVPESHIKFEIWDTAGQERYHSLAPMYYRGASAAVVVFDITHAASYQRAKKWIVELRQNVTNANLIIALVGNKADLVEDRTVEEGEAKDYANELDLLYFETSAKENVNVEELFNTIAEKIPKQTQPRQAQQQNVQLHQQPTAIAQRSSCC
eukprot:jgi/Picre1/28071/NNA_001030.t1